jgi:hypothetical protein
LLANGADVHGTVRRQHWYGFTYDTDLKEGDQRININKAGPSTLYTASGKISDCTVSINAFRNGTGGVATTMSSIFHGPHWECIVKESIRVTSKIPTNESDERRRGLTFCPAGSNAIVDDGVISTLGGLKIDHVTEYQSFHEWHVGRKFSSSSKGVVTQVPIQLKLDKERDEHRAHWVVLEKYLAINGGIVELESEMNMSEAHAEDASTAEDEMEQTSQEPETVVEFGSSVDEETRTRVEGMIHDATDTTERNVAYCKTLADELKAGGHKDILEELVNQMGGKIMKSYNGNRNMALSWLESDPHVLSSCVISL